MPSHAPRPCTVPSCPHLQPCPVHGTSRSPHIDRRPSAARRGYDHAWAKRSAAFLSRHPICEDCGQRATHADHVPSRRILVAQGVADPDADQYLHARCASCHSSKTDREDGGFGNRRAGGEQKDSGLAI